MAKNNNKKEQNEGQQRRSRKEVLIARKHAEEQRKVRIVVGAVVALLVVVFAFAIVYEYIVAPNRPVAEVNDTEISLQDWQKRVEFERAQYINVLENQLEAVNDDIGLVQQFSGQLIMTLYDSQQGEILGQTVLNTMLEDVIIAEEAANRGIVVTDEDIDEEIASNFNYFGGDSPTPFPTPTETIEPTPSLTPIPTQVITEVVPTNTPFPTPTMGPTSTPFPTATPVSEESFQEDWNELLDSYKALGVSEEQYREYLRTQLLRQRLADAIAEEQELPTEGEHASFFVLTFDTEEEANEAAAAIAASDFLTVWNEIRSRPFDPESESTAAATELLWRTQDDIASNINDDVAAAAFDLPMGTPSDVILWSVDEETQTYIILQVSGRELRPLTEDVIQQAKVAALTSFVDQRLANGGLNMTGFDEGRTPLSPRIDDKFLAQPTATAVIPTIDASGGEEEN